MALTNYEKQKRWREKNRALYNLQQRNRRKKGGDAVCRENPQVSEVSSHPSSAAPTVPPAGAALNPEYEKATHEEELHGHFTTKKVGEFRMVVIPTQPSVVIENKPLIFKDDYGRVISERAWNMLQKKKEDAKKGGYVIDDYSQ